MKIKFIMYSYNFDFLLIVFIGDIHYNFIPHNRWFTFRRYVDSDNMSKFIIHNYKDHIQELKLMNIDIDWTKAKKNVKKRYD